MLLRPIIHFSVILSLLVTSVMPLSRASAAPLSDLPQAGTMVPLSQAYQPAIIRGITVHKDDPFVFDFIVDAGQDKLQGEALNTEGDKLVKYFLAALAVPEKELWVNLSPYEKERIIPEGLGQTDMGRDLLAQDYILKQLTASLIYPGKELGKNFWDKVYSQMQAKYGKSVNVPVNTFNKVWIMADQAEVFERAQTAMVTKSHLKVMLEEDYLAMNRNAAGGAKVGAFARSDRGSMALSPATPRGDGWREDKSTNSATGPALASQVIKEIILPELEREVNTGKNFAPLRQIFHSIILAGWYKNNLKEALLNQVYSNQNKVRGIDLDDKTVKQQIYEQYLKAYKKGVFNFIKDDMVEGRTIPRKYFSGGIDAAMALHPKKTADSAMLITGLAGALLQAITVRFKRNEPKVEDKIAPSEQFRGIISKLINNLQNLDKWVIRPLYKRWEVGVTVEGWPRTYEGKSTVTVNDNKILQDIFLEFQQRFPDALFAVGVQNWNLRIVYIVKTEEEANQVKDQLRNSSTIQQMADLLESYMTPGKVLGDPDDAARKLKSDAAMQSRPSVYIQRMQRLERLQAHTTPQEMIDHLKQKKDSLEHEKEYVAAQIEKGLVYDFQKKEAQTRLERVEKDLVIIKKALEVWEEIRIAQIPYLSRRDIVNAFVKSFGLDYSVGYKSEAYDYSSKEYESILPFLKFLKDKHGAAVPLVVLNHPDGEIVGPGIKEMLGFGIDAQVALRILAVYLDPHVDSVAEAVLNMTIELSGALSEKGLNAADEIAIYIINQMGLDGGDAITDSAMLGELIRDYYPLPRSTLHPLKMMDQLKARLNSRTDREWVAVSDSEDVLRRVRWDVHFSLEGQDHTLNGFLATLGLPSEFQQNQERDGGASVIIYDVNTRSLTDRVHRALTALAKALRADPKFHHRYSIKLTPNKDQQYFPGTLHTARITFSVRENEPRAEKYYDSTNWMVRLRALSTNELKGLLAQEERIVREVKNGVSDSALHQAMAMAQERLYFFKVLEKEILMRDRFMKAAEAYINGADEARKTAFQVLVNETTYWSYTQIKKLKEASSDEQIRLEWERVLEAIEERYNGVRKQGRFDKNEAAQLLSGTDAAMAQGFPKQIYNYMAGFESPERLAIIDGILRASKDVLASTGATDKVRLALGLYYLGYYDIEKLTYRLKGIFIEESRTYSVEDARARRLNAVDQQRLDGILEVAYNPPLMLANNGDLDVDAAARAQKNILVLDDNPQQISRLEGYFKAMGYSVVTAQKLDWAKKLLGASTQPIHIIISDMELEGERNSHILLSRALEASHPPAFFLRADNILSVLYDNKIFNEFIEEYPGRDISGIFDKDDFSLQRLGRAIDRVLFSDAAMAGAAATKPETNGDRAMNAIRQLRALDRLDAPGLMKPVEKLIAALKDSNVFLEQRIKIIDGILARKNISKPPKAVETLKSVRRFLIDDDVKFLLDVGPREEVLAVETMLLAFKDPQVDEVVEAMMLLGGFSKRTKRYQRIHDIARQLIDQPVRLDAQTGLTRTEQLQDIDRQIIVLEEELQVIRNDIASLESVIGARFEGELLKVGLRDNDKRRGILSRISDELQSNPQIKGLKQSRVDIEERLEKLRSQRFSLEQKMHDSQTELAAPVATALAAVSAAPVAVSEDIHFDTIVKAANFIMAERLRLRLKIPEVARRVRVSSETVEAWELGKDLFIQGIIHPALRRWAEQLHVSHQEELFYDLEQLLTKMRQEVVRGGDVHQDGDMAMKGGIDLVRSNELMLTRKEGVGVKMDIDPNVFEQIKRDGVDGLSPQIINVRPIVDILRFITLQ